MDIQEEWNLFVAHLRTLGVIKIGRNTLDVITNLVREASCSLGYNDIELMWETWQAARASVPEGFVLVKRDFTNAAAYAAKSVDGRLSAFKYGDVWNVMIEAQEPSND